MPDTEVQTAFFSYCREDSDFALKLAEDLKTAGAHVWIDQLDIEPGMPWDRAVEGALAGSPRMLVVLSPVSVNSDNVRDEVSFALARQKRVIPVLYRDCDVPFRLARLQHIDFRADYARGLKILLRALGVGQSSAADASATGASVAKAVVDQEAEQRPSAQPQQEVERRVAADEEMARARGLAAEKSRLEEKARREAEEKAEKEKLEQERRAAAEQVRFEEERRLAAERAKSEAQERKAAEEKARELKHAEEAPAETTSRPAQVPRGFNPLWIVPGVLALAFVIWLVGAIRRSSQPQYSPPLSAAEQIDATQGSSGSPPNSSGAAGSEASLPQGLDASLADTYRKALAGDAAAMCTLGYAYDVGKGAPKDDQQAFQWYQKSAEGGDRDGMQDLGLSYAHGQGVKQDYSEALRWFRKAAALGQTDAMVSVGVRYENGEGVAVDDSQAAVWYRKASNAGNAMGTAYLAARYEMGKGVPKDKQKALTLYRKAAAQGDPYAKDALKRLGETP